MLPDLLVNLKHKKNFLIMPNSKVIDVVSLDEFKKIIQDEKKVSVAHFWASWANQCAPMDEALKVLADEVDSTAANFLRVSMYTR